MHKTFREYITKQIDEVVSRERGDYKRLNSMPRGAGASALFVSKSSAKVWKYFQVQFVPDKYYVLFNVQWSYKRRFPDELAVDPAKIRSMSARKEALKGYDEAWVPGDVLGGPSHCYMDAKEPSDAFLLKIYSKGRAEELVEFSFSEDKSASEEAFVRLARLVGWDMLIQCFGSEILQEEDIRNAVGSLTDIAQQFIFNYALPFLDEV